MIFGRKKAYNKENDMDYFKVGKIVNTFGIKGELKVYPYVDDPSEFDDFEKVFIKRNEGGELKEYAVRSVRYHKGMALLGLLGINDMTGAEKLKECEIFITRDMAKPCGEDEYFIKDLYDMEVITDEGEALGILSDIIFTGANDVYVVKTKEREILIPAIKQCILKVDTENKKMTVKLLEGLR